MAETVTCIRLRIPIKPTTSTHTHTFTHGICPHIVCAARTIQYCSNRLAPSIHLIFTYSVNFRSHIHDARQKRASTVNGCAEYDGNNRKNNNNNIYNFAAVLVCLHMLRTMSRESTYRSLSLVRFTAPSVEQRDECTVSIACQLPHHPYA